MLSCILKTAVFGTLKEYDSVLRKFIINNRFEIFYTKKSVTTVIITKELFGETWDFMKMEEKYSIRELLKTGKFYSIQDALSRFLFRFLCKQKIIQDCYWSNLYKREEPYSLRIDDCDGYIKINGIIFCHNCL